MGDSGEVATRQKLAIQKELNRIENGSIEGVSYVPIPRTWWMQWRLWVAGKQDQVPGPLRKVSPATNDEQMICWIPANLYESLYAMNRMNGTNGHGWKATGIRLSRARWSFSWHYGSPDCCSCCGSLPAPFRCGSCKQIRYCDSKCQDIHWRYVHQDTCRASNDNASDEDDLILPNPRPLCKGLVNLGNSCFMNATVQCLIAARPLLKYFLRDEWQQDLRPKHRNIAVAFADLCKALTFGNAEYVNPSQLKSAVSKLSTGLFAGYQQHDAEELLLFLLDTLHEELDVVVEKGAPPKEDEDQWIAHRRREQSVIDSYTLGSYETATKCPRCSHESLKTDVYKHLNLALPPNSPQRVVVVVVVRQALHASLKALPQRACQTRYAVLVKKEGTCEFFQREVAAASRVPFNNLWFVSVERGTVMREIQPNMLLKKVPSPSLTGDVMVVAYEIGTSGPPVKNEEKSLNDDKDDDRHIICMFARGKKIDRTAIPVCVSFSASKTTVQDVVTKLKEAVARSTQETDLQFFLSDSAGRFDSVRDLLDASSSTNFVDFVPGEEYKTGQVRVSFVVCLRPITCAPIKSEFADHESCTRLKAQLVNELKGESVLSCLRHFVQPSTLDEQNCWKCPKCSAMTSATQVVRFTRLPEILILVLKRFDMMEGKITSLVRFDVEGMDMSDFLPGITKEGSVVYDLFAVVNHYGSMVGGHYTAFVARDLGDSTAATTWDEIDDSKRLDLSKDYVVSPAAYILFYRKRAAPL